MRDLERYLEAQYGPEPSGDLLDLMDSDPARYLNPGDFSVEELSWQL